MNNELHAESDDANNQNEENTTTITLTARDEHGNYGNYDTMETLSKLSLFTDNVYFHSLLWKVLEKIAQNRLQTIRQSPTYNYFKLYTLI